MFSIIKQKIINHKTLISNFGYLSALRVITMLMLLATYPYLIRVLGTSLWGEIILAQTVVSYFIIIINFGFDISATKDISIHRENKEKLSEIVSSVLIIKIGLFFLSFIILLGIIYFIPFLREEKWLYILSFGICINELMFPIWYFQGIEKMKYITYISLIPKVIFFILIFIVIKEKTDYLYVPLLTGVGAFIGGLVSLFIVFINHKIKFSFQKFNTLKIYFKENIPLFFSNIIISVKDRFNIIFIGFFLGTASVAIYDLGIKLMSIISTIIGVVNQSIYPKMAKELNIIFFKKFLKGVSLFTIIGIIILQVFLPFIIKILGGKELLTGINAIRILLISPIIFSIGNSFGMTLMPAFKKYKGIMYGMIFTSLFYFILIGLGYLTNNLNNIIIFSTITVLTYLFELIYRYLYCKKEKLI